MDRRQILAGVIAGSYLALVRRTAAGNEAQSKREDSVLLIGNWYLSEFPEEKDESILRNRLAVAMPGFIANSRGIGKLLDRDEVQQAISSDFRNNDVVSVGGWLLARTELRLCALAAISQVPDDY